MANPDRFADRITLMGRNIPEKVRLIKIAAVAAIDQVVVLATPVDTGRARANWQVGLNAPKRGALLENFDKGGSSTISRNRTAARGTRAGETVYISNNLPYINRLNEGYSAQAPANFVLIGIRAGVQQVKSAIRTVGVFRI